MKATALSSLIFSLLFVPTAPAEEVTVAKRPPTDGTNELFPGDLECLVKVLAVDSLEQATSHGPIHRFPSD